MKIKRGQIWYANLGENKGSVQNKIRTVIIIQNNIGNKYSTTYTVLPTTTKKNKKILSHAKLKRNNINKLDKDSVVLNEQITTISKEQLIQPKGIVTEEEMKIIERKLMIQLGLRKADKNEYNII